MTQEDYIIKNMKKHNTKFNTTYPYIYKEHTSPNRSELINDFPHKDGENCRNRYPRPFNPIVIMEPIQVQGYIESKGSWTLELSKIVKD